MGNGPGNSSSKYYSVRSGLSFLGLKDLFSQCSSKRKCAKRNVPQNEFVLSCFSSRWQRLKHLNKGVWVPDTDEAKNWWVSPLFGSGADVTFPLNLWIGGLQYFLCDSASKIGLVADGRQQTGQLGARKKAAWRSGWWTLSTDCYSAATYHADMGFLKIPSWRSPATEVSFTW